MKNLLNKVDINWLKGVVAAGSSIDDDSAVVDTQGYDGVIFMTTITDSAATGVATMTVEQGTLSDASDMAALSGAVATATSATNDDLNNKLLAVDVYRPAERYVRVNRASATANIAYGEVVALLYKGTKLPVSHNTSHVAAATVVASPAEA